MYPFLLLPITFLNFSGKTNFRKLCIRVTLSELNVKTFNHHFCSYAVKMYQEIHQAAAEGDVDTVRRLLEDASIKNSVKVCSSVFHHLV